MPTLVEPVNPNRIQDSCCGKCNVSAPHDEHGIALTGPLRGLHVDEGNTIGFGSVLVDAWLVVRGVDTPDPRRSWDITVLKLVPLPEVPRGHDRNAEDRGQEKERGCESSEVEQRRS